MKFKQSPSKVLRTVCGNEKGVVLAVGLILLTMLFVFGIAASRVTTTDIKIAGNYKVGMQALYAAQGGSEEARQRLRRNATDPIIDNFTDQTAWRAFIASDSKAKGMGYNSSNAMHIRRNSYQSVLDYAVLTTHTTDSSGNILYWGDTDDNGANERTTAAIGPNIYTIMSYGSSGGGIKIIELECTRNFLAVPAPLYVKSNTTVMGNSTYILGGNAGSEYQMPDGTSCGNNPKRGMVTPLSSGSVTTSGGPHIAGEGGPTQDIKYNGPILDLDAWISDWKPLANYSYSVTSATLTGNNWGTPTLGTTLQDPSSCSVSNIVYFDTNGTYVNLIGGTDGCGVLLIDGDLQVGGNFYWYGVILVSGSVTFTGGGNKQITGALLAGDTVDADVLGGNTNIVYCSQAILDQANDTPLIALSWKELN